LKEGEVSDRPIVLCIKDDACVCVFDECPIYKTCEIGMIYEKEMAKNVK